MKKKLITLCIFPIVFLTGCSTPSDFVKEGATAEFRSAHPPLQVASCIARNGDEFFPGYSGAVRNSGVLGEPVEVVVRAGENLFSLFQISPLLEGSQIKVFFRSHAAWLFPKKDGLTVEERLTKGCL